MITIDSFYPELQQRVNMMLIGIFAVVAMLLASIGIYGVISYSVTQRTQEIGIRMALGAKRTNILQMIIHQGMGLILLGLSIGMACSFALSRIMVNLLYGVSPTDTMTFVSTPLVLIGVALTACYIPARRAAKVDPMTALRNE